MQFDWFSSFSEHLLCLWYSIYNPKHLLCCWATTRCCLNYAAVHFTMQVRKMGTMGQIAAGTLTFSCVEKAFFMVSNWVHACDTGKVIVEQFGLRISFISIKGTPGQWDFPEPHRHSLLTEVTFHSSHLLVETFLSRLTGHSTRELIDSSNTLECTRPVLQPSIF